MAEQLKMVVLRATATIKGMKYISLQQLASPLWELMHHMGSYSVTGHQAEVTFQHFSQPIKLLLNLVILE